MLHQMRTARTNYLRAEMAVSAAASSALSVIAAVAMFAGLDAVPYGGSGGLVVDAIPQGIAIAFMATAIPTWLARRRGRTGAVAIRGATPRGLPRNPLLRGLLAAICGGALMALLHAALLPLLRDTQWPFGAVLVHKAVTGALMGAGVTLLALRYELGTAWDVRQGPENRKN